MKTLIRKGVFETNSSSSHSISLAAEDKDFILDTIYPDQDGVIKLTGGEFGWDWFKHNDAQTKANYAAVDLGRSELLVEVIKEQTGAKEVLFLFTDDHNGPNWSYIDHDSTGTTPRDKQELRNFIFNKNSWLFGGNDNSEADPTFYDVPEFKFNSNNFIKGDQSKTISMIYPRYQYELIVDGLNKTTKYKESPSAEEIDNGMSSLFNGILMTEDGTFLVPEMTSSIYFQISRRRDFFELSYWILQDYSKGYVVLTKENQVMMFKNELEKKGLFNDKNYEEKENILREEILKHSNLAKKVSFTLKEI